MTDEQVREWLRKLDQRYSWRGQWDLRVYVVEAEQELPFRPFTISWPVLADEDE